MQKPENIIDDLGYHTEIMDVKYSKELQPFKMIDNGCDAFTKDTFTCELCKTEMLSIDDYVTHMLEEEKCILVMEASKCIKDLLLPRFKRNNALTKFEDVKIGEEKISSWAVEVEVGKGLRRWKCKICRLTFSRQTAVLSHFKLAKHEIIEEQTLNKDPIVSEAIKIECKDNQMVVDEETHAPRFDTKDNFKNIPLNVSNLPPVCHICGQIFKSASIVTSHIRVVHSDTRSYVCKIDDCCRSFKTKGSLVRHVRRHTGDRPFKCLRCSRSYRESGALLRHQHSKIPCYLKPDTHIPRYGVTQPFSTGVKADGEMEVKVPLKKERMEEDCMPISLEDLQEPEETKAKIRKEILHKNQDFIHLGQPSSGDSKDKSSSSFPSFKDTKKEYLSYDSDDQMDMKKHDHPRPPEETYTVKAKTAEEDLEDESGRVVRRCFMCPVCYKTYSKMSFLSTHINSHLAELGKECSTCKKQFTSHHAMSRHLLTHSSARQFECRECGKTFKLKSHALTHLKSHSSIKAVPCSECGRLFKSVSSRNNHMKIHVGERDYECAVCFKKFLVKSSFVRHLRVHTQEKPYQCPYCKQSFKEHGTLNRHIRFKMPCSRYHKASADNYVMDDLDVKPTTIKDDFESSKRTLNELNDSFSDVDSELESYLSEKWDLSSIYSEHSNNLPLSPDDFLQLQNLGETFSTMDCIKTETTKKD